MATRKLRTSDIPERRTPGEEEPVRCSPGSIEQQLDMCETGDMRGDDIQFHHGMQVDEVDEGEEPLNPDGMSENFQLDMSEEGREGDEWSGDEHSNGLQGDKEPETEDVFIKVQRRAFPT